MGSDEFGFQDLQIVPIPRVEGRKVGPVRAGRQACSLDTLPTGNPGPRLSVLPFPEFCDKELDCRSLPNCKRMKDAASRRRVMS